MLRQFQQVTQLLIPAAIDAERIRAWRLDQSVDKMENEEKVDRNFTPPFTKQEDISMPGSGQTTTTLDSADTSTCQPSHA